MATRRTKSRKDIVEQAQRISDLSDYLAHRDGQRASSGVNNVDEYIDAYNRGVSRSYAREQKAFDTAARYVGNIQKSKSYQNARNKAQANPSRKEELRTKAYNRQYSQRTYMGLSNG